eukprot:9503759-Pyramimonas_sp.AAC.3
MCSAVRMHACRKMQVRPRVHEDSSNVHAIVNHACYGASATSEDHSCLLDERVSGPRPAHNPPG